MAHTMTAAGVAKKNAIAGTDAWLILVEVDATGIGGGTYRRTSDEWPTEWAGDTYAPTALSFGEVQENLQGGLPRVDMALSNLDAELRGAALDYGGLQGAVVTVNVVPSGNLFAGVAEITEVFTVIETTMNGQWLTMTLGFADPLGRRFPRDRYTSAFCRHQYKGPFCRYAGALATCDRTLKACIDHSNTRQFGGSPGVDEGVFQ